MNYIISSVTLVLIFVAMVVGVVAAVHQMSKNYHCTSASWVDRNGDGHRELYRPMECEWR